jgi:hypothetical protein
MQLQKITWINDNLQYDSGNVLKNSKEFCGSCSQESMHSPLAKWCFRFEKFTGVAKEEITSNFTLHLKYWIVAHHGQLCKAENFIDFSVQANYTDRSIAAYLRS